MWQDLPGGCAALDIGFRLKEARTIDELHLYIPGEVSLGRIRDLSKELQNDNTISAIFNDVLSISSENSANYIVQNQRGQVYLRVVYLDFAKHLRILPIKGRDCIDGTVITFTNTLLRTLDDVGDYYVRFRIMFTKSEFYGVFASKYDSDGKLFISAFARTDIIEFRVNERRNFSKPLRNAFAKMWAPDICAIHFLLARSIDAELIKSHTDFRKMRKLEPDIWDSYLSQFGKPERMVIYHWRSIADQDKTVEDFMALAIFRKFMPNYSLYAAALLLFGGFGSTLQALATATLSPVYTSLLSPVLSPTNLLITRKDIIVQFLIVLLFTLLLMLLYRHIRKTTSETKLL
jgi:hypothetical protein